MVKLILLISVVISTAAIAGPLEKSARDRANMIQSEFIPKLNLVLKESDLTKKVDFLLQDLQQVGGQIKGASLGIRTGEEVNADRQRLHTALTKFRSSLEARNLNRQQMGLGLLAVNSILEHSLFASETTVSALRSDAKFMALVEKPGGAEKNDTPEKLKVQFDEVVFAGPTSLVNILPMVTKTAKYNLSVARIEELGKLRVNSATGQEASASAAGR